MGVTLKMDAKYLLFYSTTPFPAGDQRQSYLFFWLIPRKAGEPRLSWPTLQIPVTVLISELTEGSGHVITAVLP